MTGEFKMVAKRIKELAKEVREETLSDKGIEGMFQMFFWEEDVKNFIKELKEECCECHMHPLQIKAVPSWKCWFCVILNKRAGKELVKGGNQDGKQGKN